MSSVNKVILIGHVGQQPELKATSNGVPFLRLSLATTESWKDKATGQRKENTTWHGIKIYDAAARALSPYIKKGSKLYVEGSLRTVEYEKDGQKVSYLEVLAKDVKLLDKFESQEPKQQFFAPNPSPAQRKGDPLDFLDDEVPF